MKVVYTPIDIEFDIPNEQKLIAWFEEHKLLDNDYWEYAEGRHIWCLVASREPHEDWRSYKIWRAWAEERQPIDNAGLYFHPGFEETFPGLASAIRQLPFKQIGAGGFLQQIGTIPPHRDAPDKFQPTEPRRYIIYITDPAYNTFYIKHGDKKIIPQIDSKYRCFAFDNTDIEHGADPTDRTKIILSFAGIIDNEKHEELLARSIEKFKNKVIRI